MLLDDNEINARMSSPLNLLNRLRNHDAKAIDIPSLPPKSEELVENLDDKIKAVSVKRTASEVMQKSLTRLNDLVETVEKPERLARIAKDMGAVVESMKEDKDDNLKNVQVLVYRPEILTENHYQIIQINE